MASCTDCPGISFPSQAGEERDSVLKKSFDALQSSARSGCKTCRFLYHGLKKEVKRFDKFNPRSCRLAPVHFTSDCDNDGQIGDITVYIWNGFSKNLGKWSGPSLTLEAFHLPATYFRVPARPVLLERLTAIAASCPDSRITRTSIVKAPYKTQCFSWIRDRLRECEEGDGDCHFACRRRPRSLKMPSRLLDLQLHNSSEDIRLLSGPQQNLRYVALSYCWGSRHPIKTTSQKIEMYESRISFTELPQSFRDAVLICRSLNIRYLWIDNLCIVQDSPDDWAKESATMADVYQGAYFTLALASAEDSTQPILSARRRVQQTKLPHPLSWLGLRRPMRMTIADHWGKESDKRMSFLFPCSADNGRDQSVEKGINTCSQ